MWTFIVLFGANGADDGHAKEKRGKIISFDISARERDVTSFSTNDATYLIKYGRLKSWILEPIEFVTSKPIPSCNDFEICYYKCQKCANAFFNMSNN